MLAFLDHFGIADDDPRVNPYGGAIAIGHPLAVSGVRLMTQLAREFAEHPEVRYGLTTMCVGLGMGGTVIWENPHRPMTRRFSTSPFPDEVVTRALVRYVDLPDGAGDDRADHAGQRRDHTRPSHVRPGRAAGRLRTRWTRSRPARPDAIAAIAVTGKPFIFAVGADLTGVAADRRRDEALEIGRLGHAVFRRLGELGVPTFAFVNGAVMGGGLELALHCHYRTLASGVAAIALPECFLGLVPGLGRHAAAAAT